MVKNRHGRLSQQFVLDITQLNQLKQRGFCETTKPPALPQTSSTAVRAGVPGVSAAAGARGTA